MTAEIPQGVYQVSHVDTTSDSFTKYSLFDVLQQWNNVQKQLEWYDLMKNHFSIQYQDRIQTGIKT